MPDHRYLIVDAEPRTTGLRDEFSGMLRPRDIELAQELWKALGSWVRRYQVVATVEEKRLAVPLIREAVDALDAEGLEIARRIQTELGLQHKVRYFSAARAEYLNTSEKE